LGANTSFGRDKIEAVQGEAMDGFYKGEASSELLAAACDLDARRVESALKSGAVPDCMTQSFQTPLRLALREQAPTAELKKSQLLIVRALLKAGADPEGRCPRRIFSAEGSPLMIAARLGLVDVVQELLAHGADPALRQTGASGWTAIFFAASGSSGACFDMVQLLAPLAGWDALDDQGQSAAQVARGAGNEKPADLIAAMLLASQEARELSAHASVAEPSAAALRI
jgi:ankyrin repeat protein